VFNTTQPAHRSNGDDRREEQVGAKRQVLVAFLLLQLPLALPPHPHGLILLLLGLLLLWHRCLQDMQAT
jgi:hypothetical protein